MERRLAAIMAGDMVGYSRLMATDEAGTIARHKTYRDELIDRSIAEHDGRVVKTTGDGFLVEFASVVRAVECALHIQKAIADKEMHEPVERRIQYRIGVNLGDIVVDGDDILGDGVNVAARLEQIADAGGICISDLVYQNIKGKIDARFESLGRRVLKNIPGEIDVYRLSQELRSSKVSTSTAINVYLKLPDKTSIAVLPFTNMSSDREQEFFADGMTEELITALSRIHELFVISRNSSFMYKGRAVRLEDVAKELGVRFILEGSVRVAGSRVRVTAQLIDGVSGAHVWAERFDGGLDDIFAVQDEIARNIVLALQIKLVYGDTIRLWEGQTTDLRAWEKMVLGREKFLRFNTADTHDARRILNEALAIDPNYTGAMIQLGMTYYWEARYIASADKEMCLKQMEQLAERALSINPEMGSAFMLRGMIALLRGRHEEALELCQKAIDRAPSDSWAISFVGTIYMYEGDSSRAVETLRTAMRLSPLHPSWCIYYLALANLWSGDLAAALEAAETYLQRDPDELFAFILLAIVYGFLHRDEEAVRLIAELRRRFPDYSIGDFVKSQPYKESAKLDQLATILRRVGLPD